MVFRNVLENVTKRVLVGVGVVLVLGVLRAVGVG
jgi:hypothetical protein